MLSDRGRSKLIDIRSNIALATGWVQSMDSVTFAADVKTFYAVTRALEIISEASRGLDAASKDRLTNVPWRDIAGAGNIYRHDYNDVHQTLIWDTVRNGLPALLEAVEMELAGSGRA